VIYCFLVFICAGLKCYRGIGNDFIKIIEILHIIIIISDNPVRYEFAHRPCHFTVLSAYQQEIFKEVSSLSLVLSQHVGCLLAH
jgi:hypothetical protein